MISNLNLKRMLLEILYYLLALLGVLGARRRGGWSIWWAVGAIFGANVLVLLARGQSLPLSLALGVVNSGLAYFLIRPLLEDRERSIKALCSSEERARQGYEDMLQFAHIAAHDLQSPLATISGFAGLLRERYAAALDEEGGRYIGFLEREAQGASRKVEALLQFSRVETRGEKFVRVDTGALVRRVVASLQADLVSAGGGIEVKWLPVVKADEMQLERVFQNLICNAIKYRQRGRPLKVLISARRGMAETVFCVADNGIGIPPGYQEKIFSIFGRLHDSNVPGDGIGLAIVKRIIERHGGQVYYESQVGGGGSRFYFTIPDGG